MTQRLPRLTKDIAMKSNRSILRCEEGATAIEYALIASLVAIAAFVAMNSVGGQVSTSFNKVSTIVSNANV